LPGGGGLGDRQGTGGGAGVKLQGVHGAKVLTGGDLELGAQAFGRLVTAERGTTGVDEDRI
jgi:hypothetical protein